MHALETLFVNPVPEPNGYIGTTIRKRFMAISHSRIGERQLHVNAHRRHNGPCSSHPIDYAFVEQGADNMNRCLSLALKITAFLERRVVSIDHISDALDKHPAALREFDARGAPVEDPEPDLSLHERHMLAQRRLGDIEFFGCFTEIQLIGQFDQFPTVGNIHSDIPYCSPTAIQIHTA
ncbi:hypothetical protein CE91St30_18070 [Raoultibacter timonensis]|uniref:Uncharacterized protein n=1 Tax=Raoultibacter timonensis TaxID=1907662 RepID=A0ABM7WJJ9_9ACTN|nr:hypothetical protein CE91St30_18070 [Raoultibacter timonensis]BDF51077.1 hypothetical protein CE91St31_18070 [Raoultibacter timonensis]